MSPEIKNAAHFCYDVRGNRTQSTERDYSTNKKAITNYTYDANNRLTGSAKMGNLSFSASSGTVTETASYTYDDNGNMLTETTNGVAKNYTYDYFNRLVGYSSGSTTASYTYSTNNLRASKTINGTKTTFVWNGQNLASETKSGTTTAYTYDPTGIISSKTGSAALVRFIKDPHGNVVATSQNNSVFGTYDYTAFGKQIEATNTTNPFRYCGEYYDNESGLTYLRNRYYNSQIGRFISEDPIRDGANWYVYGNNNPIAFVDPWGLGIVPGDLDWNGDGFVDSKMDRKRFDANVNGTADWIESGYLCAADWYEDKDYNILNDFIRIEQSGQNTCTFASISMILLYLTGQKISDRYMTEARMKEEGIDDHWSMTHTSMTKAQKFIREHGFFDNSNYAVGSSYNQSANTKLTPELVKRCIDGGIPMFIDFDGHARVVIGYDFSNEKQEMILADPQEDNFQNQSISEVINEYGHYGILLFNRVR